MMKQEQLEELARETQDKIHELPEVPDSIAPRASRIILSALQQVNDSRDKEKPECLVEEELGGPLCRKPEGHTGPHGPREEGEDVDAATGCADDQIFKDVPAAAIKKAADELAQPTVSVGECWRDMGEDEIPKIGDRYWETNLQPKGYWHVAECDCEHTITEMGGDKTWQRRINSELATVAALVREFMSEFVRDQTIPIEARNRWSQEMTKIVPKLVCGEPEPVAAKAGQG